MGMLENAIHRGITEARIMNRADLPSFLNDEIVGSTFASVVCLTNPRCKKGGNPWLDPDTNEVNVIKKACHNVILNFNYENSVNTRRKKEGKEGGFQAKAAFYKHFKRADGTMKPVVEHKTNGTEYLKCKLERSDSTFWDSHTAEEIQKADLAPWLPKQGNKNQGVDQEVLMITPKLDNIIQITVNNVTWNIV